MSKFGQVQKNVLCQYIEGQNNNNQQEKRLSLDKLNGQMTYVQNLNFYPFSAFAFVEVLSNNNNTSFAINQSPTKSKNISSNDQEENDYFIPNQQNQSNLLTGVLIGPQHLLVQLDNPELQPSDIKVNFGISSNNNKNNNNDEIKVVHIFRSSFLALNRFAILILEQSIGLKRGYLGMLSCKRTFNTRYFYALDSIVEPDVQAKKKGVIISGYLKNQGQSSFSYIHNQVSDIMGGVLINVQLDKNYLGREYDNFARNHWPILVNDSDAGFCVVGFTQELNSKGIKGILINSEQFNQIVLFTQNYQPQDILRIPCCAQLSEDEYKVDVKSIKAHRKSILSVARINYRLMASSDNEKKLKIWQIDSRKVYSEIDLTENCYCLIAEGRYLYVCLQDKIQVWDWQLNSLVSFIQCPYPIIHLIKINSKYMVSADLGGQIIIWKNDEMANIIMKPSAQVDCTEVTSMISFNEKFIAVGFINGKIKIFDLSTGNIVKVIDNGHYSKNKQNQINTLLVFNQEYLVSGSNDCQVIIWSLSQEYNILKKIKFNQPIQSISALNEKEMLIAHGNNICVYNMSSDVLFNLSDIYQSHSDIINFCTTIDHEQFSTADKSGIIRFWKIDKVNEEIFETITKEELIKISDQLKSPSNYNYFFFRNFVQFSQSQQLQQSVNISNEKQQPIMNKEKLMKSEIEQSKLSQMKYQQDLEQITESLNQKDIDLLQKNKLVQQLQKEVTTLNQRLSVSNNKFQEQVNLCQNLQMQINNFTMNEDHMAQELDELRNKYSSLSNRIQDNNQNKNNNQINERLQKDKDQLQKQVAQLNQTIKILQDENNNLNRKINSLEDQIMVLNNKSRVSPSRNNDSKDKELLQKQITQLNNTITILESQNNKQKNEILSLKQEKQQSMNSNRSPSRLSNTLYSSNQNSIQINEELQRLKQENNEQIQKYDLLSEEYEAQRLDILEKNKEIEFMKNSIKTLKDSFQEIQTLQTKKYKLDILQKDKEKESILNILNEQRQQNQILTKTLEQTREQHIKNLQESNKERRQILENQNSVSISINSTTPNYQINSTNSRQYSPSKQQQQQLLEDRNSINPNINHDSLYLEIATKQEQKASADIQSFKNEISSIQGQISQLKKSLFDGNSVKNNQLNQSDIFNSKRKEPSNDRYNNNNNNNSPNKTAFKNQGYYLDPHSQTPIQNKNRRSLSNNLINSSTNTINNNNNSINNNNISPSKRKVNESQEQPMKHSKTYLQTMLQQKLQELQDELASRQSKSSTIDFNNNNSINNNQQRGRSPNHIVITYTSPSKQSRYSTSSPNKIVTKIVDLD